jgi:hypothetical protein
LDDNGANVLQEGMEPINLIARSGTQAEMVQANPALHETVAVPSRSELLPHSAMGGLR